MKTSIKNRITATLLRWWHYFIYKPDTKEIYWDKIISSTVVLVSFIIWSNYNQKEVNLKKQERNNYARYTIGITTDYHNNIRSSYTNIDYEYKLHDSGYNGTGYIPFLNKTVRKVGGRYYVKYSSINPYNAEILFDHPVPDSVLDAPLKDGIICRVIRTDVKARRVKYGWEKIMC